VRVPVRSSESASDRPSLWSSARALLTTECAPLITVASIYDHIKVRRASARVSDKLLVDQPTNQPTNQTTNQPNNQTTKQPKTFTGTGISVMIPSFASGLNDILQHEIRIFALFNPHSIPKAITKRHTHTEQNTKKSTSTVTYPVLATQNTPFHSLGASSIPQPTLKVLLHNVPPNNLRPHLGISLAPSPRCLLPLPLL